MANMSLTKQPMPHQDPEIRNKNFNEVALGYTPEIAKEEALRCLDCRHKPCVEGCPVRIDIPRFIKQIREGDEERAYRILSLSTSLPAVCGRVCPQESQCEQRCVRGLKGEPVAIGRLERYVADRHNQQAKTWPEPIPQNGHRIAIVGSGPSGLSCAGDLARMGYEVTVFEALHAPGGVLIYGIPEFRLPKSIVETEIKGLLALGVTIETNWVVGRTISVDDLFEQGFEAVYIATGAGLPRFMNIPGESLNGVCSANEFLTRINLMKAYQPQSDTPLQKADSVVVVGGGNVAMDAARSAKRLGAQVTVVYRRGLEEMPARQEEIQHAVEEGVVFKTLCNPVAILGDQQNRVTGITCVEMELGEPDESGRRRPVEKAGSEFTLKTDSVVMAIGTSPNPLIRTTTPGLETDRRGCIVTDERGRTSRDGVFAGGDVVSGAATVILAMGAGKTAAAAIHEYIQSK